MKNPLNLVLSALVCGICTLSVRADLSYSNAVMALAPVAYWPLDETNQPPPPGNLATNLGTSGAAYDGYYNGTGLTAGETGALVADPDTAVSFNGSYLDIPYGPAETIAAPFTVEAWLNAEGNTATACALSAGQFSSPRAGWLIYNFTSGWSFRLYNLAGTATSLNLTGGTIDANWHHIVAVYDGTNGFLYQDGVLVAGPTASTGYVPNPNTDLTIGARSDNSFPFNGEIDEVAIYTNALSSADVLAHYNNGISSSPAQSYASLILAKKPEFYYRLDETIATTSSTVMATNYGSLGSAIDGTYLPGTEPATAGPAGKGFGTVSHAVTFVPASGGYVDCTTDPDLDITTNVTVAAWFKTGPADSRFQSFLGRSDQSYRADVDASGYAHFADGSGNGDAIGQKFINDAKWHFFAGVYDGSALYVYIDGALDQTNVATAGVGGNSAADMAIGGVGDYIPGRLFKGSVAQVAIFAGSLSGAQIQTLYNAGELVPTISSNPSNVVVGLGLSGSLTTAAMGSAPLVYRWYNGTSLVSDIAGNIAGSATSTLTFTDAQLRNGGNYTVVVSNSFGSVTSTVAVVTVTPSPAVAVEPVTNTLIYAGNQLTLNASVIGASPLSYQWYKGTSPIAGATTTNLTLTAVVGTNFYHLSITNSYGSTTSTVARVVGQMFVAPASGLVVNFAAVANGNPALTFVGQGAYNDPGNNVWNGIPGSGVSTGLASNSVGSLTLVSATDIYGFNNTDQNLGGAGAEVNGDPSWLLTTEDAVNGTSPGVGTTANPEGQMTISDLPQGTYDLYLYADNYDGTRGSIFSVAPANGGGADQGENATTAQQQGYNGGDATTFVEGDDYVLFTNVVADATGAIVITYVPNDSVSSGLTGEAPFNGVQVVMLSTANVLSIKLSGSNVIVSWTVAGGTLQSAPSVAGPWTAVTGATSPYTTPVTGAGQFFRVH